MYPQIVVFKSGAFLLVHFIGKRQAYPYIRQIRLNASAINSEKLGSIYDDLMWVKNNKVSKFLVHSHDFLAFFLQIFLFMIECYETSLFFNVSECLF